jgi:hypothetical protein
LTTAIVKEKPSTSMEKPSAKSKNTKHNAHHVVSAWASEKQITLGEITVEEKSNEITRRLHEVKLIQQL